MNNDSSSMFCGVVLRDVCVYVVMKSMCGAVKTLHMALISLRMAVGTDNLLRVLDDEKLQTWAMDELAAGVTEAIKSGRIDPFTGELRPKPE